MKFSKILIFVFSLSVGTIFGQVQTGPGGVGSASDLQIWLDASSLAVADGAAVASISDQSGNGNDFSQVNAPRQPLFVSASSMNSRPALSFDGGDDFMNSGTIAALSTQNLTWYTVHTPVAPATGTTEKVVFSNRYLGGGGYSLFINSKYWSGGFDLRTYSVGSPQQKNINSAYSAGTQIYGGVRSASSFVGYKDGNVIGSFVEPMIAPTAHDFCRIGASSTSAIRFFDGLVGEVIVYSKTLNETENIILSNYLSSKYGKAMAANDKYALEGTHSEEIAGIGRVSAGDDHLSARGTDIVQVTSAGLDDGDFLLWGNDGGDLIASTSNMPTSYTLTVPVGNRFERSWRFEETGETGDLAIRFDLSVYGFSPTSDYELLIDTDNDGDFSNAVAHSGVFSGSFVTFNILGSDLSDGNWVTLGNPAEPIESIVDGQDWGDPTTWDCGCVPSEFDDVRILAGHSVTVSDEQEVSTLTVDLGGELVISSAGAFNVFEALDVRGNTDFDINSVVRFVGPLAQNVFCTTSCVFGKLTVDNANGVSFSSGDYSVRGLFRPEAGVVDFTGSTLMFTSTATQTAKIGVMGATASITGGTIYAQRFIAAGSANSRNLATPFATNFSLREWDDEIFISGLGFPDGCVWSRNQCHHSAKTWVPATASYADITDLDDEIISGTGIEIYLGDNLSTFSAHTLTSQGSLSATPSVDVPIQSQWNLIGNPMLCPVDFDDCIRNDAGIGNYYYVLNPQTNAFEFWDGANQVASVASLDDGYIASHQGFWVFKSNAGTSSMTFNQNSKDTVTVDNFMKSNINDIPSDFFKIQLISKDREYMATTLIKRGANFRAEMDESDLPKFPFVQEGVISVYTKTKDGKDVTINTIGDEDDCLIIPIYMDVPKTGEYKLSLANLPFEYEVDIYDKVEKTFKKLSMSDESFMFEQEIGEGVHRFNLRITKSAACSPILDSEILNVKIYSSNADIVIEAEENERNLMLQVLSLSGQKVAEYSGVNSDYFRINTSLDNGIYLVNLVNPESLEVIKTEKVFINR